MSQIGPLIYGITQILNKALLSLHSFPSRELAEGSPYYEAFRRSEREVLFCYDEHDEITMLQMREFDRKLLRSVESEMAGDEQDSEKDQPAGMLYACHCSRSRVTRGAFHQAFCQCFSLTNLLSANQIQGFQ